jgi:hypothetical protein
MSNNIKKNIVPISVKGKKKLLAPLSINNKSVTSTSTKSSIKENEVKKDPLYSSREKFELDCDNDKKEDAIFLSKLSEREKFFYEIKAKVIYDFLKSINLIRYIDSFINDGFETKEDLMEIQEDYFEENKNFNKNQQKKILLKAKEYLNEFNEKNIQKSISIDNNNKNENQNLFGNKIETGEDKNKKINKVEMGVGGEDINEYFNNTNSFNRCWTCFNKLKDKNYIEISYENSIVTRKVRFCSEKCQKNFELNIYTICDNCFIKYDKSKGDFIYKNNHFHSQKCLDDFVKTHFEKDEKLNSNMNIDKSSNNFETDNYIYDPMNDF